MGIEIRKINKKDDNALIDICYITGDITLKKIFPDPYLFGLFWCLYFAWHETDNCFVAVDTNTSTVIGYILSTLDTMNLEKSFEIKQGPLIKKQMKELQLNSVKSKIYAHFIIHRGLSKRRKRLLGIYPAHLHINLLPKYQRQGIGHKLMQTLEKHLLNKNIVGYHLEVGAKNKLGINFYRKYGLTQVNKNKFTVMFAKKLL